MAEQLENKTTEQSQAEQSKRDFRKVLAGGFVTGLVGVVIGDIIDNDIVLGMGYGIAGANFALRFIYVYGFYRK